MFRVWIVGTKFEIMIQSILVLEKAGIECRLGRFTFSRKVKADIASRIKYMCSL
jgi:hypothetical protein